MTRRVPLRLVAVLVACLLLVTQGCKGRERPGVPGRVPGALTRRLDSLSADSLVALAASIKYIGDTTIARRCDDDAGCAGDKPARTASVTLSANQASWLVGPGTLPPNGVIIARVRNTGHREARYGFKPGQAFEYYLIAMPGADSSHATWRIEEVSGVAGRRSRRTLSQGPYSGCGHAPWQKAPLVPIGFYSCENSPHIRPDSSKSSQVVVDPSLTAPIWTSCDIGCCTASAT